MAREFDRTISDKRRSFRINVAVTVHSEDWVHLNIRPFDNLWPNTTLLISNVAATELAQALLEAVSLAVGTVPEGWESIETTAE